MSRSRGEPPLGLIDNQWPHQVALPIDRCTGKNYEPPHAFCRSRNVYHLCGKVSDDDQQYLVFRFSEPADAALFRETFAGIPFYPEDRIGRRWKRPPGDVRRPAKRDPYDWS